ncbi:MAG: hypothetical protein A2163_08185 [Actinobacteria bacterium RBG_13_35_12]|nr:MAG: hypothetical protein A2163_08185 [Actinobacteria bacterium RBG_13_35_12]
MSNSICFVNDLFLKDKNVVTTGPMVQMYLIGKELANRGWQVSHIVHSRNNKDGMIEEHEGMYVYYLPYHRYGELMGIRLILKKLNDINADIYYQRGRSPMTGMTAYFTNKNSKKFVWSSAGEGGMARGKYIKEQLKKKSPLRKIVLFPYFWLQDRVYEYGIKNADIVFAQTEYQLNELKKEFNRDGIIFRSGHPIPDISVLKKPNPPVVLWVGAIKKSKQPELFLELAKNLKSEKAEFYMIGNLSDEKYREPIIFQEMEQKNFHYAGEVPFKKMTEWFSKASLLINTTMKDYEGLPNVFIQSWLHGVPVVSLHSDPDDFIKKHEIGYQTGDFILLVERVKELIRNLDLRNEMGKRARDFAVNEFGIKKLVDQFVEICKEL